jgi:hypothetical protein
VFLADLKLACVCALIMHGGCMGSTNIIARIDWESQSIAVPKQSNASAVVVKILQTMGNKAGAGARTPR